MKRTLATAAAVVVNCLNTAHAQDAATLARIRDEGMNRSHVVELFNHLTNVIGPRLTGSPAFLQSIDWSVAPGRVLRRRSRRARAATLSGAKVKRLTGIRTSTKRPPMRPDRAD